MTNMKVLTEALTFISDNPDKHKQHVWTCGTGACLAGWVTLLNGYENSLIPAVDWFGDSMTTEVENGVVKDKRGHRHFVSSLAEELLDIDPRDATILFNEDNTIEDLKLMAKDLENGEDLSRWIDEDGNRIDPDEEEV